METYHVRVRNEHTGEIRTVAIPASFDVDAQVSALTRLFKLEGWRKATALHAEPVSLFVPLSD